MLTRLDLRVLAAVVALWGMGSAGPSETTLIPFEVSLVTVPANQPSAAVTIHPLADNQVESPETAVFTIAPNPGYTIGAPASATETGPDPGTITLTRSGGHLAASLNVSFARSGTAAHISDYVNIGVSETIPAGQAVATVAIAPVDDLLVEGAETVILTINAGSNYVVGAPAAATVTIADND